MISGGEMDEEGNFIKNDNLILNTATLTHSDLSNINYESSVSASVNVNVSIDPKKSDSTTKDQSNTKIDSSQLSFNNKQNVTKTKTLATLGEGEVTIGGVKTQTPSTLNRDTDNVDKDIYKVEQSNSIEMTVDHRLLSEDGQDKIKDDVLVTTATTVNAAALVGNIASGNMDTEDAIESFKDPYKVAETLQKDVETAAVIDAHQKGESNDLVRTQEALNNLNPIDGVNVELTTVTEVLGVQGTTNQELIAIDTNEAQRENTIFNYGHELSHVRGGESEVLADMSGLATDLLADVSIDSHGSNLNTYKANNGVYDNTPAIQENNTDLLNKNNVNLLSQYGSEFKDRQLNNPEMDFVNSNAQVFAKDQGISLKDAKARLAQQGLKQTDKAWSLVLGDETDVEAQKFLQENSDGMFSVKDEYEFKDGTTNGQEEISDLSTQDYNKLKDFYSDNIYSESSQKFLKLENLTDNEKTANTLKNMSASEVGEATNQAIRDFVPNTIKAIVETPETINSAINFAENVLPTTTQERMDELYNQGDAGSKVQANLATMDMIGTASMVTGAGAVVKHVVGGVTEGVVKSVDDSLQINTNELGLGDVKSPNPDVKIEKDSKGNVISREPKSLQDQMSLEGAKRGEGDVLISAEDMNDPKYAGTHDKYEYVVKSTDGKTTVVHYVKDKETGELSDFKFKNHGEDGYTQNNGKYEKQAKEQGGIVDPDAKQHNKELEATSKNVSTNINDNSNKGIYDSNEAKKYFENKDGAQNVAQISKDSDTGRQIIATTQGQKGGWNPLLNKPEANTDYKFNDSAYKTDDLGRVQEASFSPNSTSADRNLYQQSQAGQTGGIKDGLANDQGGHINAAQNGGAGEQINYLPQDAVVNNGNYKKLENIWAQAAKNGDDVKVTVKPTYTGNSKRPDSFDVSYSINGEKSMPVNIPNKSD
jgi:hypothetical protein